METEYLDTPFKYFVFLHWSFLSLAYMVYVTFWYFGKIKLLEHL